MNQKQADRMLMDMALRISQESTCNRAHVGCIISQDTRCVSQGYNGAPVGMPHCPPDEKEGCTRTIHAEINAILFAARKGVAIEGATLYTTLSPCLGCSQAIINSGIIRVVYQDTYRITEGIDYLKSSPVKVDRLICVKGYDTPASIYTY